MEIRGNPVRGTIIYGLLSAILFVPVTLLLSVWSPWGMGFRISLWVVICGYCFLLTWWSKESAITSFFPLLVLFFAGIWVKRDWQAMMIGLAVLAWIRSGLAFKDIGIRKIAAEITTAAGCGVFFAYFEPAGGLAWSISIWAFFLIQSIYFLTTGLVNRPVEKHIDRFEQARRRAEQILAEINL